MTLEAVVWNCPDRETGAMALRLDSVDTARSSQLRLNTYSGSVQPVWSNSSAWPSCRTLAPFRLRMIGGPEANMQFTRRRSIQGV